MRLKGKVALITGASRGIGREIALRYAEEGATVAVNYRSNKAEADKVVSEIAAAGGRAAAYRADCSRVADIEALAKAVADDFGGTDILVNNAGVFMPMPIEETTEADWDAQVDLNLKGPFFLVKAVVPGMKAKGGGRIVNITSIAGENGFPNASAYCGSKGGLANLTRALACELAPHRINVNAVAPGNIKTDMNAALRGPGQEAYVQMITERTPGGVPFIDPKDLTGAALFLASDDCRAMHGATLLVDEGWAAW